MFLLVSLETNVYKLFLIGKMQWNLLLHHCFLLGKLEMQVSHIMWCPLNTARVIYPHRQNLRSVRPLLWTPYNTVLSAYPWHRVTNWAQQLWDPHPATLRRPHIVYFHPVYQDFTTWRLLATWSCPSFWMFICLWISYIFSGLVSSQHFPLIPPHFLIEWK